MRRNQTQDNRNTRREQGFILPLAVLLVVILTISGTSFMHLDYLERLMGMNEVDNHGAFYLANAGIERAREVLKIPTPALSWTTVLQGANPSYPSDPAPVFCPLCVCGPDATRGCVMPFAISAVTSPDSLVFGGTFDDGSYTVRAFNNEAGTTDTDQTLTIRAVGTVLGEQKLIQVNIQPISKMKLINCNQSAQATSDCPHHVGSSSWSNIPGRDPASFPSTQLPSLPPLQDPVVPTTCNSANYYCNSANFSGYSYSFSSSSVSLSHLTANHRVIVTLGDVNVGTQTTLTDSIIVAQGSVSMNGSSILGSSTKPYPAMISGGTVHGDTGVTVNGNIYSTGGVDLRGGATVTGSIISTSGTINVTTRGSVSITDASSLQYYALMPGFTYPKEQESTVTVSGSWLELQ